MKRLLFNRKNSLGQGRDLAGRDAIRTCHAREIVVSVAGSLALHAVLIALFWFSPASAPFDRDTYQQPPLEVELISADPSKKSSVQDGELSISKSLDTRAARAAKPKHSPKRNLELAPSFKPKFSDERQAGDIATGAGENAADSSIAIDGLAGSSTRQRGSTDDGSDYVDDPQATWGSGGADFGRVADFVRLERLYRAVDSRLIYPSILAYHGISGTVNARLVITKKGCDWRHTTITASEPHLRVYILDVLQRTCQQSLAEFARADRASNVDFSFSFAQTEHNDQGLIQAQNKIVGNVMLFYRNSHASVAEWKLGPIRGLFPIPAAAVDFVWLKLNWDKFVGKPDPMADSKEKTDRAPTS